MKELNMEIIASHVEYMTKTGKICNGGTGDRWIDRLILPSYKEHRDMIDSDLWYEGEVK